MTFSFPSYVYRQFVTCLKNRIISFMISFMTLLIPFIY